ncbi:MAG: hypothetical protein JSS12_09140 [Verrucomicrobia bacterium]|nr:hypothetical protein [Verrucomicrobiota bacterium]
MPQEQLVQLSTKGQEIYFKAYDICSELLQSNDAGQKNDQAIMDDFFGFYIFHEANIGLRAALESLINPDALCNLFKDRYDELTFTLAKNNNEFYSSLIPQSLLRINDREGRKGFEAEFKKYAEAFVEKFSRNQEVKSVISTWLENYNKVTENAPHVRLRRGMLQFYDPRPYFRDIQTVSEPWNEKRESDKSFPQLEKDDVVDNGQGIELNANGTVIAAPLPPPHLE